jgi:CDP-diacylglycerol--glycerol-3-phosphate 3-phosphatidyltransferase
MLVKLGEKIILTVGGIIGRLFMALRLSPNAITVMGLAFTIFIGVLYGMGSLGVAGALLVASCMLDSVDGLVARKTGRITKFGGFLDSSLDRYADMALYGGLLVFVARDYQRNAQWLAVPVIVLVLAAAGAFAVSYTKARGDLVVGEIKQGYWGRVERLICLIIGTGAWRAGVALWLLAIFPHLTVIHRMLIVKAKLILTGQENPVSKGVRRHGEVPDSFGDFGRGLTPVTRRLWWAKLSPDGSKVIFPLPLRILFLDFKRGSIPYDIACLVFGLAIALIPIQWVAALNALVMKYLA